MSVSSIPQICEFTTSILGAIQYDIGLGEQWPEFRASGAFDEPKERRQGTAPSLPCLVLPPEPEERMSDDQVILAARQRQPPSFCRRISQEHLRRLGLLKRGSRRPKNHQCPSERGVCRAQNLPPIEADRVRLNQILQAGQGRSEALR